MTLAGCVVMPYSTPSMDFSSGSNPFSEVTVAQDSLGIIISISDDKRDLSKLKVTKVMFTNLEGKSVATVIKEQNILWTQRSPNHQGFHCLLTPRDSTFQAVAPFNLKLEGYYGSEPILVEGKFTDQTHYHVTNAWKVAR